jgi:hypothetical protein
MNPEQFAKYVDQRKGTKKAAQSRDRKFYKKRIHELTRQLLNNDEAVTPMHDVLRNAFDNYVTRCIQFFKIVDKADIIQGDYEGLDEPDVDPTDEIKIPIALSTDEANQYMMRSIKLSQPQTLDNFVIVNNPKPQKPQVIPKRREINLKTPELKNKGIRKKKNITEEYDESFKKGKGQNSQEKESGVTVIASSKKQKGNQRQVQDPATQEA